MSEEIKVIKAIERAIGDILYMANERGELGRFKSTINELEAALATLQQPSGNAR